MLFSWVFVALAPPTVARALPPDLALVWLAHGEKPVAIRAPADGSGRLFVVERGGLIKIFDPGLQQLLPTPFLDLSALVDTTNHEQGLLGLVFHPNFAANRYFYVVYIRDPGPDPDPRPDRTVLRRYRVSGTDPNVANPASAFTILEVEQPSPIHKGGDLFFGSDSHLYLALGDGGPAYDALDNAQNPLSLLGKMLRIDVDGPGLSEGGAPERIGDCGLAGNYTIPPDNPFVGDPLVCDEIFLFGLRNPWRWSFDRATSDFLIGDVGQDLAEEIDFLPAGTAAGANLGWSCREGNVDVNFNPCRPGPLTEPVLVHPHNEGSCAIIGGYRYRGSIPGLQGVYVYGDWCSGKIYAATADGNGAWSSQVWVDIDLPISGFGEDEKGELYVAVDTGDIFAIRSLQQALFADGFESASTAAWSATFSGF